MLGFLKNAAAVGYYTAASHLVHMVLSVVTALGQATLPRLSNLLANEDQDAFKRLAEKSYRFILLISIPMSFGLFVIAPSLIRLFCGAEFAPAIPTIRILSFVIIALGLSNLFGMQILYPQGKIKLINISVAIGAMINLILNFVLIPKYAQDGAAMATIVAEFGVTTTQVIIGHKYFPFNIFQSYILKILIGAIIMSIATLYVYGMLSSDIYKCILTPVIGVVTYYIMMIIFKDSIVIEVNHMINKIFK